MFIAPEEKKEEEVKDLTKMDKIIKKEETTKEIKDEAVLMGVF